MVLVNIYEEYRNVIFDSIKVKHIYRKIGGKRFYICQFALESEVKSLGLDFARKFYLVKTYLSHERKPSRFEIKTGDVVRCFYSRSDKREPFILNQIIDKRTKETLFPHSCYREKPIDIPMYTLYE